MSVFMLGEAHIDALVNLGEELDVTPDGKRAWFGDPAARTEAERSKLAYMLTAANVDSVVAHYDGPASGISGMLRADWGRSRIVPQFRLDPMIGVTRYAEAVRWVHCYRYQCDESPQWSGSQADRYTTGLLGELGARMADCVLGGRHVWERVA